MTARPRRPLSAEERRLWAEIARSVRPLDGRSAVESPAAPLAAEPPPSVAGRTDKPVRPKLAPPPKPPAPRLPPLAPIERRTARALARGQQSAAAVLDLHGLTQAEAHPRLIGFLRRAQSAGQGLVLVVTGRGASGPEWGERGVLRRTVPHWLRLPELRPLVLGFEEAGTRQGGAGALYVRLRRARPGG